jgi:hypothetical protein
VPWCESCQLFRDSEVLSPKGECPGCGQVIEKPKKIAWHFKLVAVATIIYLVYRFVQIGLWIAHKA